MPVSLFFVASLPLYHKGEGVQWTCRRRPRAVPQSCAKPAGGGSESQEAGDPQWIDLARSLGATSESEPVRPPPEWKLPDDEDTDPNAGTAAWAAWNQAISKPEAPFEERDPQKETDFWRGAARDVTPASDEKKSTESSVEAEDVSDQESTTSVQPTSTEIWRLARGVTGEMSNMQERLRADLERYNPEENKDQYRDIARELVGPPSDEPWSDDPPVRTSDMDSEGEGEDSASGSLDVEAGSGWNPDVDWMRFEDLRREQSLKSDVASRSASFREAENRRQQAYEELQLDDNSPGLDGSDDLTYVDENGTVLSPEEVEKAMQEGAVFLDESGMEINTRNSSGFSSNVKESPSSSTSFDPTSLSPGKVPGFIANRSKSGSTYGAGWSGAEEEIKVLQEKGIPLRDPKADVESWRSAARELNIEVGPDGDNESAPPDNNDKGYADGTSTPEDDAKSNEDMKTATDGYSRPAQNEESTTSDVSISDDASLWSSWREGSRKWKNASESLTPRDPKKEVDMWRVSARELTQKGKNETQKGSQEEVTANGTESGAWDSWRSANAKWESSVAQADETTRQSSGESRPLRVENVDWGSGLNTRATSDRAAWENWNSVKWEDSGRDASLWWSSRTDSSRGSESRGQGASKSNTDQWRSFAREVTGVDSADSSEMDSTGQFVPASARQKSDSTVDFWKEAAKDMTTTESIVSTESPENHDNPTI